MEEFNRVLRELEEEEYYVDEDIYNEDYLDQLEEEEPETAGIMRGYLQ